MNKNKRTSPWLGTIPSHWKQLKLRQILFPFNEKEHADAPLLSVIRERGAIVRDADNDDENHNFIPDDSSGYKVVRKGQFAMNKIAVVKYIRQALPKYEDAIEKLTEEVAALEEYKNKLIANIVAGKIDVRDIEIPERDRIEEDFDEDAVASLKQRRYN